MHDIAVHLLLIKQNCIDNYHEHTNKSNPSEAESGPVCGQGFGKEKLRCWVYKREPKNRTNNEHVDFRWNERGEKLDKVNFRASVQKQFQERGGWNIQKGIEQRKRIKIQENIRQGMQILKHPTLHRPYATKAYIIFS